MARGEMLTIFCYDVSDDRLRNKVSKLLEECATRVQYSVFEARMTRKTAEELSRRIEAHLEEGDSLRVYCVGANGEKRSGVYGDAIPLQNREGYWLF